MSFYRFKYILSLLWAGLLFGVSSVHGQAPIQMTTEIETRAGFWYRAPRPSTWMPEDKFNLRLGKEPIYQSSHPRFGKIAIGNHEPEKYIAVVIDETEGKPPRIYIDANNNHDLTDDGSPLWPVEDENLYQKEVTIKATFVIEGNTREVTLPYTVTRFKSEKLRQRNGDGIVYYRRYGRSGHLRLAGKDYLVTVTSFNNQGLYSNTKDLLILIDRNHDGKLDQSPLSAEMFFNGEPFNIDGESYRIASASELGDKIQLEMSSVKVSQRYYIEVGQPAPDVSFVTLAGQNMKLSDYKGKVVLLDFWATWCGPCIGALPGLKKLYDQFNRSQFEVIGVSLDGGDTKTTRDDLDKFLKASPISWPLIFDNKGYENAIAQIFNISGIPVEIVVDQNQFIQLVLVGGGEERMARIQSTVTRLTGK